MTHKSCNINPLKMKVNIEEMVPFVKLKTGLFTYFDSIYPDKGFQVLQNNLKDFAWKALDTDVFSWPKAPDVPRILFK